MKTELYSMITDAMITVICAAMVIVPWTCFLTLEPNELGVFKFIVLFLSVCVGFVGFIAGITAVVSYFFE